MKVSLKNCKAPEINPLALLGNKIELKYIGAIGNCNRE
jgi:hypothetical protein